MQTKRPHVKASMACHAFAATSPLPLLISFKCQKTCAPHVTHDADKGLTIYGGYGNVYTRFLQFVNNSSPVLEPPLMAPPPWTPSNKFPKCHSMSLALAHPHFLLILNSYPGSLPAPHTSPPLLTCLGTTASTHHISFFWAMPTAYRTFWARDQTCAPAAARATAVTTLVS